MTLRVASATTDLIHPYDRCAYWESYSSEHLVDLSCTPFSDQGLVAQQSNVWAQELGLSFIQGNQHVIERSKTHIQRNPKDSIFVSFDFISPAFFYQGKSCHSVRPNDMVIYRTDNPYLFGFKQSMRQIIIELPSMQVKQKQLQALDEPLKITAQHSAHQLLVRTLAAQCRHFVGQPRVDQWPTLYEQVQALFGAILNFELNAAQPSALSTLYVLTACQFIAERLEETSLNNEQIAAAAGITERHLQRVFAQYRQSSVQEYVMEQRLQRAARYLQQSEHAFKTLEQIALDVGFSSSAHFSRRFKQHFKETPSQFRAASLSRAVGPQYK